MRAFIDLGRFFAGHPLTSGNPLAAWLRFARWQVRSRLSPEVCVPWIGDVRIYARRGMSGLTGNIYVGLHEFTDMMVLLHFLRPADLFADVGANVGSYTLLASGVCGAQTIAFEPDPEAASHLLSQARRNGLTALVGVEQCAIGASRRDVHFTVGRDATNQVAPDGDPGARIVPQQCLDDALAADDPVMMKIDVEGHEEQVLLGARRSLAKASLRVIELETVSDASAVMLHDQGFERAYYDPFSRRLAREPGGPPGNNALYVRDWAFVEKRLREAAPVVVLGQRI